MVNMTDITYMSDKDLNELLGYDDTETYTCEDCGATYRESEYQESSRLAHICSDCSLKRSEKMERDWDRAYQAYGAYDPELACITDAEYYI